MGKQQRAEARLGFTAGAHHCAINLVFVSSTDQSLNVPGSPKACPLLPLTMGHMVRNFLYPDPCRRSAFCPEAWGLIALILVCINTVLNINPATVVLWSGFYFFSQRDFAQDGFKF